MSSPKRKARPKTRRKGDRFPPDAKVRKVLVTLELLTEAPQNELRAWFRNQARAYPGNLHQVHVQAVRPSR